MKYKIDTEGEVRSFESIEDVIDFVEDKANFEVDSEALRGYLDSLELNETWKLWLDGKLHIQRIA
ncbi:hypothetical protein [Bacillus wiedmannii]|uniref:hypothetical protein n=1 Tax=Bacillus wiedmannii TaxID=1890302 RepID=UPI000BEDB17E|nr:hypothetical protein [Bacillus wiedmannii]PEA74624.1 hypothetical protein CON92_28965 [Bacillus wiedmannii]